MAKSEREKPDACLLCEGTGWVCEASRRGCRPDSSPTAS